MVVGSWRSFLLQYLLLVLYQLDKQILGLKKHETPPSSLPLLFMFARLSYKYSVCCMYAREAQLDKHKMSTAVPLFGNNYSEVPAMTVNNRIDVLNPVVWLLES
jgi:hypothetical protein